MSEHTREAQLQVAVVPVTSRSAGSPEHRRLQLSAVLQSTLQVAAQAMAHAPPPLQVALLLSPPSVISQLAASHETFELAPVEITQSLEAGQLTLQEAPQVQSQLPASPHEKLQLSDPQS